MAYSKKVWKARKGIGLGKYKFNGVTDYLIERPGEITYAGTELTADSMNDLESRIEAGFNTMKVATIIPNPAGASPTQTINQIKIAGQVWNIPPYTEGEPLYLHRVDISSYGYGVDSMMLFICKRSTAFGNTAELVSWLYSNGYRSSSSMLTVYGYIYYTGLTNLVGIYTTSSTGYDFKIMTGNGQTESYVKNDKVTAL